MVAKNEEWRTVPDWDCYEISNFGRLRGKVVTVKRQHTRDINGSLHNVKISQQAGDNQ